MLSSFRGHIIQTHSQAVETMCPPDEASRPIGNLAQLVSAFHAMLLIVIQTVGLYWLRWQAYIFLYFRYSILSCRVLTALHIVYVMPSSPSPSYIHI